ncbi:hypothetical protein [Reyranella sp.]|jgi:hypothetical protein|uniref:hypothetical protein n=1 Tax=Reyranella sp. TaxID=1929291 RepID=UPI003BAB03D3
MPIYTDVIALDRVILIVARGTVTADEIVECIEKLKAPRIRGYAKIVDVTGSSSEVTREQVERLAGALRGGADAPRRGPLAFVVDVARQGFAEFFADATGNDRPVELFKSLHEARRWLVENRIEMPGQPAGWTARQHKRT